jgi:hypothetical protein
VGSRANTDGVDKSLGHGLDDLGNGDLAGDLSRNGRRRSLGRILRCADGSADGNDLGDERAGLVLDLGGVDGAGDQVGDRGARGRCAASAGGETSAGGEDARAVGHAGGGILDGLGGRLSTLDGRSGRGDAASGVSTGGNGRGGWEDAGGHREGRGLDGESAGGGDRDGGLGGGNGANGVAVTVVTTLDSGGGGRSRGNSSGRRGDRGRGDSSGRDNRGRGDSGSGAGGSNAGGGLYGDDGSRAALGDGGGRAALDSGGNGRALGSNGNLDGSRRRSRSRVGRDGVRGRRGLESIGRGLDVRDSDRRRRGLGGLSRLGRRNIAVATVSVASVAVAVLAAGVAGGACLGGIGGGERSEDGESELHVDG